MSSFTFEPIGYIHSCFKEKFGIPRQPGLVQSARGTLEITPTVSQMEAFRRLEDFSHIWLLFVFHQSMNQGWKPTVRPPRLGGNDRVGVFASRSGFRPNAIGQSVAELMDIQQVNGRVHLLLAGVDLLDGTPVLDIKPYLPYSDAISSARAGYAPQHPIPRWPVVFGDEANQQCRYFEAIKDRYPRLRELISDLLGLDPRPAYHDGTRPRPYGVRLWDLDVRFRFHEKEVEVVSIRKIR